MLAQTIYDSILSKNLISMKKFLACLFILMLFSAFVFWTGWTQIKLKPDCCGVVVSKTHGVSAQPVVPGKLTWFPQFLLPTNAQLIQFKINPLTLTKSYKTSLPSAAIVGGASNSPLNFDYKFDFSITLTVLPEEIVELYSQNLISDDESLQKYLEGCADYITQLSANYFIKKSQENPKFRPESVRRDDLLRSVQPYKEYPNVEVVTVALTSYDFVDYELYTQFRQKISESPEYQASDISDSANSGDENE
jgi:hypothetical protein